MLLGAFFDVRNPKKVGEHPARFEATRARPARDFSSGQTSKAPGHPMGNRGTWPHHRPASADNGCRAAYTRSRVNFRRDSDRTGPNDTRTSVCGSPRFEAHGLRFGGYRALTSLSAIASAVARAVQVPAHRVWYSPFPGNGRRCLQATRRRGVGRRCENGAPDPGFTAVVRWVVGARELRPPSEWTLKGNEAHGRTEPRSRRKRRDQATDPTTEQGPEADATVQSPHELHPGNGMGRMRPTGGTPTARGQRPR
jgi:hypothetical protein